jgi:hypothetical protein
MPTEQRNQRDQKGIRGKEKRQDEGRNECKLEIKCSNKNRPLEFFTAVKLRKR